MKVKWKQQEYSSINYRWRSLTLQVYTFKPLNVFLIVNFYSRKGLQWYSVEILLSSCAVLESGVSYSSSSETFLSLRRR